MVVWLADGTKAIIQDVWVEYLAEAVAVFNFKVEDFHTYFVGYRGVLVHNANCGVQTLDDDALVVRGGQSTAENLQSNQAKDTRGHISANSGNGVSLDELATTPNAFPNGQISVTTVGEIRSAGMDVIPDPSSSNPLHVSIVPNTNPMTDEEANILSSLFSQQKNTWRNK